MDERDWLAEQFEEHRGHLRAVAYKMLGSLSEADDAVQESWLRLSRSDTSEVENLRAWLTTVVARVSLNVLRSRRTRREEPLDVRVPDPVVSRDDGTQPEHEALLADSVGLALLVVLDTLGPAERLAFVLHDMFGVPFDEIAGMVDRSPAAARQLASRARRRVQGAAPVARRRPRRSATRRRRLLRRRARRRLRRARRRPRSGRRVARRRRSRRRPRSSAARARWPRGRSPSRGSHRSSARRWSTAPPASSWPRAASRSRSWASRSSGGRIVEIDAITDPERLRALDLAVLDD